MTKINKFLIAIALFTAVFTTSSSQLFAQAENDEINIYQTMYGMEKRGLVEKAITLTGSQKESFWSTYEEYEKERRTLGLERVQIVKDYSANIETTDEAKLDNIASRAMKSEMDYHKLESKYYDKMKKAVGTPIAFRWLQLEKYLNISIRMAIYDELPFLPQPKQ